MQRALHVSSASQPAWPTTAGFGAIVTAALERHPHTTKGAGWQQTHEKQERGASGEGVMRGHGLPLTSPQMHIRSARRVDC